MAELTIRVIEPSAVLENLLLNELTPFVETLDKDASILISVKDNKTDIKFQGVDEENRIIITSKAEEVLKAFSLNQ